MSPMTTLVEQALLGHELGNTSPTIPGSHYVGLIAAASRQNVHAYSTGAYIANPTFPFSATSAVWSLFVCTTGGTTAASAPAAFASGGSAGGTITDGSVVWTEVSTLFAAGTFTAAEPSGNGYARVQVVNNTTNWPAPSGGDPTTVQNGTAVNFPTTTGSWGQIAAAGLWDASSAGNARWWGLLSALSSVATVSGVTPNFVASSMTFTLL